MMNDSKTKICGAVIAILGFVFSGHFVFAEYSISTTNGSNCGQTGNEDACISVMYEGSKKVSVYDLSDSSNLWNNGSYTSGTSWTACDFGVCWDAGEYAIAVHPDGLCTGYDYDQCVSASPDFIGCFSRTSGVPGVNTVIECPGQEPAAGGSTVEYEDDLGTLLMLFFWTMMTVLMLVLMLVPILLIGFRNVFRPLK